MSTGARNHGRINNEAQRKSYTPPDMIHPNTPMAYLEKATRSNLPIIQKPKRRKANAMARISRRKNRR